jgi:rhodanese-related sulfurtransferase
MKKHLLLSALSALILPIQVLAYDAAKAQNLNSFYAHLTQKACAESKLFITAEEVMKRLRDNAAFTLLDIRTNAENAIVSLSSSHAIHIPIAHLFEPTSLDKLPTDQPIIIVCHSGTRAVMAAMGLKQIGITNTHVLKGGIVALADANTPKNALMQ